MVKARLDLPIVEKLRQEHVSMSIIRYDLRNAVRARIQVSFDHLSRKVFDMQLRFKSNSFAAEIDWNFHRDSFFVEDDFKTDVDLRAACLILSKQVKLINGNEGNILIPQNWINAHREQFQQEQQQPDAKLETINVQVPSRRR